MQGTYQTNPNYRANRDAFLLGNEGFRTTVYFDTVGVPTVGKGIALLARADKPGGGREFARHEENIKALKAALGENSTEYQSILAFAEKALSAINNTTEPVYVGSKTVSAFYNTARGQAIRNEFGSLTSGTWQASTSPTLSADAARNASVVVVDQHEARLDLRLSKLGLDPNTLTEAQRTVLLDAFYQGRQSNVTAAAKVIKDGGDTNAIARALYSPRYAERSRAEIDFLTNGSGSILFPDIITQPDISAPTNLPIFELLVDPLSLKPIDSTALGTSTGGWGLLGSGAGYDYFMTSGFVNNDGGSNVASSFLTTDGTRVGNHTLSSFGQIISGLRATMFSGGLDLGGSYLIGASQWLDFWAPYATVPYIDPVTLDEGNDGVRFSAVPVNFDLNADGTAEALPWAAPTDPLLVLDVNGDGNINNGRELIDLTDTGAPLNLLKLDQNLDGKLDGNDVGYWDLQVWRDHNQDGYASAEERQYLNELDIASINLTPITSPVPVVGKSGVKGVVATYGNGQQRTLWDVPFETAAVVAATSATYAPGIDKVSGSGQTALVANSPAATVINLNSSGATQAIGNAGNDTLIGTAADDWLLGGAGADKFTGGAGRDLIVIDAEDRQQDIDAGSDIDTVLVADDRGVLLNLAQAKVEVVYGGYGDDVLIGGGADNVMIAGAAGDRKVGKNFTTVSRRPLQYEGLMEVGKVKRTA